MFQYVMSTHIKFVQFGFDQVIFEDGDIFLRIEFIFFWVFAWGCED